MPTPGRSASDNTVSNFRELDVNITSIDERGLATTITKFGMVVFCDIGLRRGKSLVPAVGERWLLTRDVSNRWTFAVLLDTTSGPDPVDSFDANTAFLFGGL